MTKGTDRIGQVLLIFIGIVLIISGGSCALVVGLNILVLSLIGVAIAGLGVWIIALAMKEAPTGEDDKKNEPKETP